MKTFRTYNEIDNTNTEFIFITLRVILYFFGSCICCGFGIGIF